MTDHVYLHGVALANYRGIGKELQLIGPFQRFNFLIGPNNAGKSSVINFIANHCSDFVCTQTTYPSSTKSLGNLDAHLGTTQHQVRMGIGIPKSFILDGLKKLNNTNKPLHLWELINSILEKVSDGELLWVERSKSGEHKQLQFSLYEKDPITLRGLAPENTWYQLWHALTSRSQGSIQHHWIPETLQIILRLAETTLPKTNLIPAIREISPKGQKFERWDGGGLIEELAHLQNPTVHERHLIEKFKNINNFIKAVTENRTASIEIPHDREHVLVHMDGKVLPLESLGTGIHELVMLASFCSLIDEQIVCIEEPEIHLHPILQRRFIQYLRDATNNQYFIATHSPSIIDTQDAAVFHVSNPNGSTKITASLTSASRFNVCQDLGYKASDLLQANAIVWVEGPSDRIYLRHWINAIDPTLQEGIDYSIMFYGGRLLSHLSADDVEVCQDDIDALIAMRNINRNLAILIDSDRKNKDTAINITKQRIDNEINTHGGICWITEGREIENYVPLELMSDALKTIYPKKFNARSKTGNFDHVLPFKMSDAAIFKDIDKVRVAKTVCSHAANLDILDLRERITSLVVFIKQANLK